MARSTKVIAGEESVHYVPPRMRRVKPKPKMQPPLTPMIDVTFQLLLFFLLAFQLRDPEGLLPASLPKAGLGEADPQPLASPIRIVILPAGDSNEAAIYEIERFPTPTADPNEVFSVLQARRIAMGTSKIPVIIKPRADVRWQFVIEAFNATMRAKLENVAFAPSSG